MSGSSQPRGSTAFVTGEAGSTRIVGEGGGLRKSKSAECNKGRGESSSFTGDLGATETVAQGLTQGFSWGDSFHNDVNFSTLLAECLSGLDGL